MRSVNNSITFFRDRLLVFNQEQQTLCQVDQQSFDITIDSNPWDFKSRIAMKSTPKNYQHPFAIIRTYNELQVLQIKGDSVQLMSSL
jgi:hypothetical protein